MSEFARPRRWRQDRLEFPKLEEGGQQHERSDSKDNDLGLMKNPKSQITKDHNWYRNEDS